MLQAPGCNKKGRSVMPALGIEKARKTGEQVRNKNFKVAGALSFQYLLITWNKYILL